MEDVLSILKDYMGRCYLLDERAVYENTFEFVITDTDEVVLTKYLKDEENIIIPDFVTIIDNLVFEGSNVKTVVANGVKTIGGYCFANSALERIEAKSLETIKLDAFANCTELKSVIGKNIKDIHSLSFANCINLSDIDLVNVTSVNKLSFFYCKSLQTVNLSNVVYLDKSSFKDCKLETVYLNKYSLDSAPLSTKYILNVIYIDDDFSFAVDFLTRLYINNKNIFVSKLTIYNYDLSIRKVVINKMKSQNLRKTQLKRIAKKYDAKI